MTVITNIEDLRILAQKRVPRMFYDYADSGSWTEGTYRANEADFQSIKFRQRVAVNMEGRSTATQMIGQNVAMPVAIAPTGMSGMQHADGEICVAVRSENQPCSEKPCCLDRSGKHRGGGRLCLLVQRHRCRSEQRGLLQTICLRWPALPQHESAVVTRFF